ncbi:MAG: nucleoside-diphosphate kinase, nucleoside-diphosphate kinase [Candidatus Peregrinibacteria bacterium GW2011_GWF2_33_10]|nr:MAG: nucleoside-diphosphate kinase, nucleoside-diphosphate kinase [Candidatus Peregrinibacteria bacterium GW2011_GWF2_33_10]OGJ44633.1 MAG: nucleoside-diphosphate kinase [Candidatus Peregrinibacteria bacterium RIFOXYA2_FULL_33_21]OGJ46421.1 MAG: nucleoside-diphosphate kinase [Candidatus Peregrinibacteria bacterium RIFOXYA12_FULL_33_12]OGJ50268.1 MAG: nucleoside-diphosphate kinase [Candidatus Peregrinibacteria bacterium RIFOXYB2_FULL_33_20]
MEKTLVLIKPDGIQRGLTGEVLRRFERKGLKIVGLKMMRLDEVVLREHYSHIASKPFYSGIEKFMMRDPVIAICVEGLNAVNTVRIMCGITKAREAMPGTIRGDFGMSVACNVVHASDSVDNAEMEVKRFFKKEEIFEYDKSEYEHVYIGDERS